MDDRTGEEQIEKPDGVEWNIPKWFQDLSDNAKHKLFIYNHELIHFNGRMNLISQSSERKADKFHFADSILASQIILNETQEKEIYDIGSGNGFPGVVMAIMAPDRKFFLVEKDARKAEFLKHLTSRLSVDNVTVVNELLEKIEPNSIKCAVSRGFASVTKAILAARKPAAVGCRYFHLKSSSWPSEVAEVPSQILAYWKPGFVADYTLPDSDIKMSIVVTEKKKD